MAWQDMLSLQQPLALKAPYTLKGQLGFIDPIHSKGPPTANLVSRVVGSLGVTASSGKVSRWADQSGNGADWVQATGAQQPTFNSSSINGKPGLTWNGSCGMSTTATFPAGAWTVAIAFKMASTPGSGSFYELCSLKTTTPTFSEIILSNISGAYQPYTWIANNTTSPSSAGAANALDTSAHVLILTYNGGTNTSTGSYTDSLDGSTQSVVVSNAVARTTTDLCSLGARLTSANAVSAGFIGEIGEVNIYNTNLIGIPLSQLIAYMTSAY